MYVTTKGSIQVSRDPLWLSKEVQVSASEHSWFCPASSSCVTAATNLCLLRARGSRVFRSYQLAYCRADLYTDNAHVERARGVLSLVPGCSLPSEEDYPGPSPGAAPQPLFAAEARSPRLWAT